MASSSPTQDIEIKRNKTSEAEGLIHGPSVRGPAEGRSTTTTLSNASAPARNQPGQASQSESDYGISANALLTLYVEEAARFDASWEKNLAGEMNNVVARCFFFALFGLFNPPPMTTNTFVDFIDSQSTGMAMLYLWGMMVNTITIITAQGVKARVQHYLEGPAGQRSVLERARTRHRFYETRGSYQFIGETIVPGLSFMTAAALFAEMTWAAFQQSWEPGLSTLVPVLILGGVFLVSAERLWARNQGQQYDHKGQEDMRPEPVTGEIESVKALDVRCVHWIMNRLPVTDDSRLECLLRSMPISCSSQWGTDVWRRVFEHQGSSKHSASSPPPPPGNHTQPSPPNEGLRQFCASIGKLLATCGHRAMFPSDEAWRTRMRTCIQATTALVCFLDADLDWFRGHGLIDRLGEIGGVENIREPADLGFVMNGTCLSIMTIGHLVRETYILADLDDAQEEIQFLESRDEPDNLEAPGPTRAQRIDNLLTEACDRLGALYWNVSEDALTKENVKQNVKRSETLISRLGDIEVEAERFRQLDERLDKIQSFIGTKATVIRQLPGVVLSQSQVYTPADGTSVGIVAAASWFRDRAKCPFVLPRQALLLLCSCVSFFQYVLEEQDQPIPAEFQKILGYMGIFTEAATERKMGRLLQRQLWRLQDIRDGRGLGFVIELFFLAVKGLLTNSSCLNNSPLLFIGTFRAITSKYKESMRSSGTEKILLDLAASESGILAEFEFPTDITDEFIAFLGRYFEGATGAHIDETVSGLRSKGSATGKPRQEWLSKVLRAITQSE